MTAVSHERPKSRLLRLSQVIAMTGLSRATIYRYEGSRQFPARRRVGPNAVRWLESDVVSWMESRPQVTTTDFEWDPIQVR